MAAAEQKNNKNNNNRGGGEYMKRKRSKNWTRNETLSLIRARSDELQEANSGGGKDLPKSQLWHQISQRLRRENIGRDAQQCRDKWEKLSASYKLKNPADNPFFHALHPLLSKNPKHYKHHRDDAEDSDETEDENNNNNNNNNDYVSQSEDEENAETKEVDLVKYGELLHGVLDRQQRFFRELMAALDDRRQRRDRDRAEYEERWRAEERAQRCRLTAALSALVSGSGGAAGAAGAGKRRSKNWKRAEVAALIRQRSRLRDRFGRRSFGRRVATAVAAASASASASASAWEEVSEALRREGVGRDAKQCREKWDKLVAEYKDVLLRRKPSGTVSPSAAFPYFADVAAVLAPPVVASAQASTSVAVAVAVAAETPASPSPSSASGSASASASVATAVAVL